LSDALHDSKRASAGANEPVPVGQLVAIKKSLSRERSLRARGGRWRPPLHNLLAILSLGNHFGN